MSESVDTDIEGQVSGIGFSSIGKNRYFWKVSVSTDPECCVVVFENCSKKIMSIQLQKSENKRKWIILRISAIRFLNLEFLNGQLLKKKWYIKWCKQKIHWHYNAILMKLLIPIFNKCDVTYYFYGHNHMHNNNKGIIMKA